jgi:3-methylfumaryl-CoA hydratase
MTERRELTDTDLEHLSQWVDKECVILTETLDLRAPSGLAALLDRTSFPRMGDELPPLWQWLYFNPTPKQSGLGADGHPLRGAFLPPVPLQRRMWAAGEVHFHAPLLLGETVEKQSRVSAVKLKQGSSGPLVFVDVTHEYCVAGELCISEVQTLVYRDKPDGKELPNRTETDIPAGTWHKTIHPDSILLFRYSALTSNTHRIHYDRNYAVNQEGYAGLLVQAPLTATLLAELMCENLPGQRIAEFRFRAVQALVAEQAFTIHGRLEPDNTVVLWALDADGRLAMQASARLAGE